MPFQIRNNQEQTKNKDQKKYGATAAVKLREKKKPERGNEKAK